MPAERVVRNCIERIVPDDGAAADAPQATSGMRRPVRLRPASVARPTHRLALDRRKLWPRGHCLACYFMNGAEPFRQKVMEQASEWSRHCSITMRTVDSAFDADIRISFGADGSSWSAVGRDARKRDYFPLHQPTMHFGWLDENTEETEWSRVVLHEFGHALGCVHEHASPMFTRKWNRDAVIRHMSGPPNDWDERQIEINVLRAFTAAVVDASPFDPKSIMLYAFDAALFDDGLGPTNTNHQLSPGDIEKIRELYGPPGSAIE